MMADSISAVRQPSSYGEKRNPLAFSSSPPRPHPLSPPRRKGPVTTPPRAHHNSSSPIRSSVTYGSPKRRQRLDDHTMPTCENIPPFPIPLEQFLSRRSKNPKSPIPIASSKFALRSPLAKPVISLDSLPLCQTEAETKPSQTEQKRKSLAFPRMAHIASHTRKQSSAGVSKQSQTAHVAATESSFDPSTAYTQSHQDRLHLNVKDGYEAAPWTSLPSIESASVESPQPSHQAGLSSALSVQLGPAFVYMPQQTSTKRPQKEQNCGNPRTASKPRKSQHLAISVKDGHSFTENRLEKVVLTSYPTEGWLVKSSVHASTTVPDHRRNPPARVNDSPVSLASSSTSSVPSIVITPPPLDIQFRASIKSSMASLSSGLLPYVMEQNEVEVGELPPSPDSPSSVEDRMFSSSSDERGIPPAVFQSSLDGLGFQEEMVAQLGKQINNSWNLVTILDQRRHDDEVAFAVLCTEIDGILSDFLNLKVPNDTWLLSETLLNLVQPTPRLHKGQRISANTLKVLKPIRLPPSLMGIPLPFPLVAQDVAQSISQVLRKGVVEKVCDHIATGLTCLLSDRRAPYETPLNLARFCAALQERRFLVSPTMDEVKSNPYSSSPAEEDTDLMTIRRSLFLTRLETELREILEKGHRVRDRSRRLDVPLSRPFGRKRNPMWQEGKDSKQLRKEENMHLLLKGTITEEEWRRRERKMAAMGDSRDEFTSIDQVRFVGELYKVGLVACTTVWAWLERLLFDTVHPEIASMWELECSCALIIIAGPELECEADGCQPASSSSSPPPLPQTTYEPRTPIKRNDSAPANHWIHSVSVPGRRGLGKSPTYPSLLPTTELLTSPNARFQTLQTHSPSEDVAIPELEGCCCEAGIILESAMARLDVLIQHPDVDEGTKAWLEEVVRLRKRGWKTIESF